MFWVKKKKKGIAITEKNITDCLMQEVSGYRRGMPWLVARECTPEEYAAGERIADKDGIDDRKLFLIYFHEKNFGIAAVEYRDGKLRVVYDYNRSDGRFARSLHSFTGQGYLYASAAFLKNSFYFYAEENVDLDYGAYYLAFNQAESYRAFAQNCPQYEISMSNIMSMNSTNKNVVGRMKYTDNLTEEQIGQLKALMKEKGKPDACKLLHEWTGCGLAAASRILDFDL